MFFPYKEPGCYVVLGQKKRGRPTCYGGPFSERGTPGTIDMSGTENTIKTRKILNSELLRRSTLRIFFFKKKTWYLTDREVLCMDGMMKCGVPCVARVSHGMR